MPDSVSADALQRFRLVLDTPWMRELSVAEQRYQAVMAVSRQTLHAWLARLMPMAWKGLRIGRIGRRRPHQMGTDREAGHCR